MKSILFVCLGNICRSPIAEGIAKEIIQQRQLKIHVDSAGTGHWHTGEAPCEHSISVARKHGINIAQLRARQVTKNDMKDFDLIVALDQNNYNDLKSMGFKNLIKLGSYGYEGADVPDPYFFNGFEGFENVFSMIETSVSALLEEQNQSLVYK